MVIISGVPIFRIFTVVLIVFVNVYFNPVDCILKKEISFKNMKGALFCIKKKYV